MDKKRCGIYIWNTFGILQWNIMEYYWDIMKYNNGMLLSHKKEWNYAICRDTDGPRDWHREWSKSDNERQILYHINYMWNLKKGYKWLTKQKQTYRLQKQTYHYQRRKVEGDKLAGWD